MIQGKSIFYMAKINFHRSKQVANINFTQPNFYQNARARINLDRIPNDQIYRSQKLLN